MTWATRLVLILLGAAARLPAQQATTINPHGPNIGACATCHRPESWRPARIARDFVHPARRFALDGAHARTDCTSCHRTLDFARVATACADCHRDVHAAEFGSDCARCHTTRAFADQANLKRMHELTRFPLRGAHAPLACAECHTPAQPGQSQYVRKPTACIGCHSAAYRAVKAPDHQAAGFTQDCAACHSATSWQGARFDHGTTKFALTGAHAAASCDRCHGDGVYRGKTMACVGCHQADYTWARTPPHAASGFPSDCLMCHTVKAWKGATFNHDQSAFALTGAHRTTLCSGCHADNVYKGRASACASCHQKNYVASTRPPHAALSFSTACASCHTTALWAGGAFDHATTAFALTGAHRSASCAGCHGDGVYRGKSSACVSCHQARFTATTAPPHVASGFPTACAQCHGTSSWLGSAFDHAATAFPLAGAHRAASCLSCHGDGVYRGKGTACASCHQGAYTAARNPLHTLPSFPVTCQSCHGVTAWRGASFDHGATAFPLTGAHRTATCASCHGDGVYRGKGVACLTCHQPEYTATSKPPHASSGLGTTCQQCHGTSGWLGSAYDHSATAFPLAGAHKAAACTACHGDGVYKGKPTACVACHQANYTAARTPPHASAGFPTTCQTCHGVVAWQGAAFNHDLTQFALTGAHRAAPCSSCHADNVYRGKSTLCASCHQTAYAATTQPPHATLAFSTACGSCHGTSVWAGAPYDHSVTAFPLTGAHRASSCAACHGDRVYRGKSVACVSCHQSAYTASARPPHVSLALPTICSQCHTTTAWAGGTFDHAVTRFALTGAHRAVSCNGCHADGIYRNKTMLCAGCHQGRFDAAVSPNHKAAAFPTTCEVCHSTAAWTPSTFSHGTTRFPLTGAHVAATCASCHGDGVYRGKTTLCSGCHLARYTATTNPNHRAASFPTTCESCHTTTRWTGATFNHDGTYFPIYSGKHKGRWTTCADCHTVSTNYASFSCFSCHRQSEMDSKHRGRTGYRYDSALCYQCHPTGRS